MQAWQYVQMSTHEKCCPKLGSQITTFGTGGRVMVFEPGSIDALAKILLAANECFADFFLLGGGSNIVIADEDCKQICVSLCKLDSVSFEGNRVFVGAGCRLSKLCAMCWQRGLCGLEFLFGVPCTIGGMVRMNAGAFGAQTADYLVDIDVLNLDFVNKTYFVERIPKEKIHFGYRRGVDKIVVGATFEMGAASEQEARQSAQCYASRRKSLQPSLRSCGSVFQNGVVPSGKLIDECGLRGVRRGGAQISQKHANFIVNLGGASTCDFLELVQLCEDVVFDKRGVKLNREFVLID